MKNRQLMLSTLSGFTQTLLRPYDIDAVLHDLAERVCEVLGLAGSGVWVVNDDKITYATSVPEWAATLEQAQESAQAGPCVDAYRTREITAVADLRDQQDRWPAYCAAAAEVGVLAVAGIPMHVDEVVVGALNLYSGTLREWTADDLMAAQVLANMATGYLINATELRNHRQLNEQLQQALESRVVIEQAKGLIAATHGTTVDIAFTLIREYSRSNRIALRAVAEDVVNRGLRV